MPAGLVADDAVDEGAVGLADADPDEDPDPDADGVAWCLVRAADGLGDTEAGTLATAAWKG